MIREFLLALLKSKTEKITQRGRDEQFAWLEERRDKASTLEGDFLKFLYNSGRRLPDRAQFRPEPEAYAEADFYFERGELPGVCVFCDGSAHDELQRRESDQRERGKLGDRGYRIITIRYDQPLDEQVNAHSDVFGTGIK